MKELLLLLITAISALVLLLFCIYNGLPWHNTDVFVFSIITLILIGSFVGFILALIRIYCWQTNPTSEPTPTTLYTDPPPIGSVDAEVQNDYISVFPMQQLEPNVDLN